MNSSRANIEDISLDLIDDNPYQPRADYIGIGELAADIGRNGLLQAPRGRRTADGRVQLQYGHRRLRAARVLGWETMPVEIEEVDDRAMAVRAWSENHNRQDFTPFDQARYFRRLMDDGWTQQQIAASLGLARPTISNAVRLLRLPEDVQAQAAGLGLSGRQAEALLSLTDIPDVLKRRAEEASFDINLRPSRIMSDALAGASSDDIRRRTTQLVKNHAQRVDDQPWYKVEMEGKGIEAPTCQHCPLLVRRDEGASFCAQPLCYQARRAAHIRSVLAPISAEIGIPMADYPWLDGLYHQDFRYRKAGETILGESSRCANLRVVLMNDERKTHQMPSDRGAVAGHPDAGIVCQFAGPPRRCRCLKTLEDVAESRDGTPTTALHEMIALAAARLTPVLAAIPANVLRLLARQYLIDFAREEVLQPTGVADSALAGHMAPKIFQAVLSEYVPEANNRRTAGMMLTLAGAINPWNNEEPTEVPSC